MPDFTLQQRLEEIMKAKGWEHADLMRVSGESSSVVSQWLGKGSKIIKSIGKTVAAERIEQESGYRALWVAKGEGPKFVPSAAPDQLASALEVVGFALSRDMSDDAREELQDAISSWVKHRGKERWRLAVLDILRHSSADSKRMAQAA